jgi:DNA polymerase elongation subunit (family B)
MIYVYDIETYQNYFSVIFKNVKTGEIKDFIIFEDRNDLMPLYKFIDSSKNNYLIGYNSFHFDNQILNYIHKFFTFLRHQTTDIICGDIYDLTVKIIKDDFFEFKYRLPFKGIDLMRVGNIDQKSLKLVAVNLEWPLIQDLPIKWDSKITKDDLDVLYQYNLNDVNITEALYNKLKDKIKVRYDVTTTYNIDVLNEPDSGMANRLMEKLYSNASGIPIAQLRQLRTERHIIHYENIVFESIKFESDVLREMLNDLKTKKYFKNQPFFKRDIVFNGTKYQLGIGGLHSDDRPEFFKSDEKVKIIDCDITSFYPSIIIKNDLFPAHLGQTFLSLFKRIVDDRIKAKHEGRISEADVLKICINSVFGKTLFEHHWLYDPLVGLRTTINGQLLLLMLIEKLVLNEFNVISANTDGIITIVPTDREEEYKNVCNTWCKETSFELEYTEYLSYIRTSVNDYIAVKSLEPTIQTKEKGVFIRKDKLSLMQGVDKPIISTALYNFFMFNKSICETITGSNNIYDFCIAKKTHKKFTNELHYLQNGEHKVDKLQQSIRFYISTNGGTLFKVDKKENKYINYCVGRTVSILNDNKVYKEIRDYNIDYGYYTKETQKLIDEIINPQLKLF